MEEQRFEMVSVAAIARRAGVSVGGFYARFPGKEALLHAFDEYLVEIALRTVRETMAPSRWVDAGVAEVVEGYISMAAEFFAQHRGVLKQVAARARMGDDAVFLARVQVFNRVSHVHLHGLLMDRRDQITHPDPEQAADFGVMFVSAALREMILFGERKLNLSALAGQELVRELTRAYCSYLGAPLTPDPRSFQ
jgi:AcrR family transcriptional regulator